MAAEEWSPYARVYDPLKCGSIDGTDTEPHDSAIVRAINSDYRPPENLENIDVNTILVARLNRDTTEEALRGHFKRYGNIKNLRIVRNIVTGFSEGYAFIEYAIREDAATAWQRGNQTIIDGREVVVEYELQRSLPGWKPRRLGGGFGGKKESGQLRFGCREKPFHKPFNLVNNQSDTKFSNQDSKDNRYDKSKNRYGSHDRVRFSDRDRDRSRRSRERSLSRERYRRDTRRSRSRDRSRRNDRHRPRRDRSRSRDRDYGSKKIGYSEGQGRFNYSQLMMFRGTKLH